MTKKKKIYPTPPRITTVSTKHQPILDTEQLTAAQINFILRCAKGGSPQQLFTLYADMITTDSHLQSEMNKRKLAVLADQFNILPYDQTQPADIQTANTVETQIFRIPGWRIACAHLLDGSLYPVSIIEKVYSPSAKPGLAFELAELVPVPYHLLDYSTGTLRIQLTKESGEPTDQYTDPTPDRYIVHRGHMLNTPDYIGGPLRSLVWWWLLTAYSRDWWASFIERYGSPFQVVKYDPSNPGDKTTLEQALQLGLRTHALIISSNTQHELVQAASKGDSGHAKFIELCNQEKSMLIVGQTLSAAAQSTGLGSGVANLHADVRDDLRRFDALLLAETLRDQLITQFCQINNLPGTPPSITWGAPSPEQQLHFATLLATLKQAGIEPDDDGIQQAIDTLGISLRRAAQAPTPPTPFSVAQGGGAVNPFRRPILH